MFRPGNLSEDFEERVRLDDRHRALKYQKTSRTTSSPSKASKEKHSQKYRESKNEKTSRVIADTVGKLFTSTLNYTFSESISAANVLFDVEMNNFHFVVEALVNAIFTSCGIRSRRPALDVNKLQPAFKVVLNDLLMLKFYIARRDMTTYVKPSTSVFPNIFYEVETSIRRSYEEGVYLPVAIGDIIDMIGQFSYGPYVTKYIPNPRYFDTVTNSWLAGPLHHGFTPYSKNGEIEEITFPLLEINRVMSLLPVLRRYGGIASTRVSDSDVILSVSYMSRTDAYQLVRDFTSAIAEKESHAIRPYRYGDISIKGKTGQLSFVNESYSCSSLYDVDVFNLVIGANIFNTKTTTPEKCPEAVRSYCLKYSDEEVLSKLKHKASAS